MQCKRINTFDESYTPTQSFDTTALNISDIFVSVQGEGKDSGVHALFIRTAGCNLSCPWCDTKYSWENGISISQENIVTRIKKYQRDYKNSYIVWTGGEPLLQQTKIYNVIMQTRDCYHHLETNGTIIPEKPHLFNAIAVSPKTDLDPQWLTTKNATIKLVVNTIEEADRFQEKHNFPVNRFYVMARTVPGENQIKKERQLVEGCISRGYYFTTRLQVLYGWGKGR